MPEPGKKQMVGMCLEMKLKVALFFNQLTMTPNITQPQPIRSILHLMDYQLYQQNHRLVLCQHMVNNLIFMPSLKVSS